MKKGLAILDAIVGVLIVSIILAVLAIGESIMNRKGTHERQKVITR